MIKVKLISYTNVNPIDLTSHAAKVCYQSEEPKWGERLDVENMLYKTGHHTTLQHFFMTYNIEGIAVSDITLGLHLVSPFYNSDQRSGRYCAKMFLKPNYNKIEKYIEYYWPKLKKSKKEEIIKYVKNSVGIYHQNIENVSDLAKVYLKKERPYVKDEVVDLNGPKIAQEQLRMFIPTIFPTGFDFTVNITTLAALYKAAWTPALRDVTEKMAKQITKKYPELKFIFNIKRDDTEWAPKINSAKKACLKSKPSVKLEKILLSKDFVEIKEEHKHPLDLLRFKPEYMQNSVGSITNKVTMSLATMGQDQRHRTINRGMPEFTGEMYFPPLLNKAGLKKEAEKIYKEWISVSKGLPRALAAEIAPYGAMVTYEKNGSFNAIAHEQAKRLCWCAQEEIYHIAKLLRKEVIKSVGAKSKLVRIFEPVCFKTGICGEGKRYCGRDVKLRIKGDYFPDRVV